MADETAGRSRHRTPRRSLERPADRADAVEMLLDKGLVIDADVRVTLGGIEVMTVDALFFVASLDTSLRSWADPKQRRLRPGSR